MLAFGGGLCSLSTSSLFIGWLVRLFVTLVVIILEKYKSYFMP